MKAPPPNEWGDHGYAIDLVTDTMYHSREWLREHDRRVKMTKEECEAEDDARNAARRKIIRERMRLN